MAKEYIDKEAFVSEKRMHYCAACKRRQGMKNGKMQFCYEIGDAPCRACDVADMLDYIEDFPAADVRPVVRGRWNKVRDPHLYRMEPFVGICSVCQFAAGYNEATRFFKHCPNCGAQMDADMREVDDG